MDMVYKEMGNFRSLPRHVKSFCSSTHMLSLCPQPVLSGSGAAFKTRGRAGGGEMGGGGADFQMCYVCP